MSAPQPAQSTPMMRQFEEIKSQHPDAILFYRMGDFYEMFGSDAIKASAVLGVQLTKRNKNKATAVEMCGIPVHAYEHYLNKLTKAGLKVAVCEQTEDPALAKGLVRREVVRVITPGTVTTEELLEEGQNSFLAVLYFDFAAKLLGLAFADLTTGEFDCDEIPFAGGLERLQELLPLYAPKEILLPFPQDESQEIYYQEFRRQVVEGRNQAPFLDFLRAEQFAYPLAQRLLLQHFGVQSLDGYGLGHLKPGIQAAGALLQYLQETQKDLLPHLTSLKLVPRQNRMLLDEASFANLEIFTNANPQNRGASLLGLMDHTRTPMGARLLRRWLAAPLLQKAAIEARYDAIQGLLDQQQTAQDLRRALKGIGDLERIVARIAMPVCGVWDLVRLRAGLEPLGEIQRLLARLQGGPWQDLAQNFDPLLDLFGLLQSQLLEEPGKKLAEGGYMAPGVDAQLDELNSLAKNAKGHIAALEAKEKQNTGINSLKVSYNRVFGYYLEITNTHRHLVPGHYQRKQTLVNCERYVTDDLKELEEKILSAQDRAVTIEMRLFEELKLRLKMEVRRIQATAAHLAQVDVLASLAHLALLHGYTRPQLLEEGPQAMEIIEGRHPVIEQLDQQEPFVANDLNLQQEGKFILVITGPNMGGKSTYMRQMTLIALMAQMGSFVPATRARLSLFDRIFTRVGASDNLTKGQSTFMVEMSEAGAILNNATSKSLIILDEIGRGTSTFDGISLAWAMIERLHQQGSLTLFATHYHELVQLEASLKGVANARVVVEEEDQRIIFLRKVIAGKADKSYGIQVARLAGLPQEVIRRAQEVLAQLEKAEEELLPEERKAKKAKKSASLSQDNQQISLFATAQPAWVEEITNFDVMNSSPLEALQLLHRLQDRIKQESP